MFRGWPMFTVEAPKDQRHGAEADRGGILSDDCGPGLQQVGEREVVEADHGDTVVEAQVLESLTPWAQETASWPVSSSASAMRDCWGGE